MNRRQFCRVALMGLGALGLSRVEAAAKSLGVGESAGRATVPMPRAVKLTVVRRECYVDLQSRYLDDPETGPCRRYEVGSSFAFSRGDSCPEDFCPALWNAVTTSLEASRPCGDNLPYPSEACLLSCPDGSRPLIVALDY